MKTKTNFAAYLEAKTLNGAALTSYLIAAGPAAVAYTADRIERTGKINPAAPGVAAFNKWAAANAAAIDAALLHFDW
jgi:hypothetical protein